MARFNGDAKRFCNLSIKQCCDPVLCARWQGCMVSEVEYCTDSNGRPYARTKKSTAEETHPWEWRKLSKVQQMKLAFRLMELDS